MEERLEALEEAWSSYSVEFPTYPKVPLPHGGDGTQRILFICPAHEENPTQLCMSLFGTEILIHRLQPADYLGVLPGVRFVFVFASEGAPPLRSVLDQNRERISAPILVTQNANVLRSAQLVTEYLTRVIGPFGEEDFHPPGLEHGAGPAGGVDPLPTPLPEDGGLWQEPLLEITLKDSEGKVSRANTNLQDYRAEYACRYVLAHYQENINRDKMAEMVNLSPGYFSNLFRAEVGMSFSDYLIQVRIENAKRLLRRFDLSVEAISKQCGFNSLAHFSRTFKDRCGLSPLKYRKNPNSQG